VWKLATLCWSTALTKRSFGDKRIPKLELGNEDEHPDPANRNLSAFAPLRESPVLDTPASIFHAEAQRRQEELENFSRGIATSCV
jgi:hypothetical protein